LFFFAKSRAVAGKSLRFHPETLKGVEFFIFHIAKKMGIENTATTHAVATSRSLSTRIEEVASIANGTHSLSAHSVVRKRAGETKMWFFARWDTMHANAQIE